MIKSIKVVNPKGEALVLELTNPEKSGLFVQSIEGLGPPKATINGSELATTDGMYYTSARVTYRTIVFNLGMMSRDRESELGPLSIEQSRHLTYVYFPLKKRIRMEFETDIRTVYTYGYVESNEPNIFAEEEACSISVVCPDPYMYEEGGEKTVFSGIQSQFEFPFTSEMVSVTAPEKNLIFGTIWLDSTANLAYRGTVDTGITITIHAYGPASNIRLFNVDTKEHIVINTDKIKTITEKPFDSKDDIIINTTKGSRTCQLLRNGKYTNIIGAMSRDSDWFQISNGDNFFGFDAEVGAGNISVTFAYSNAYVGV